MEKAVRTIGIYALGLIGGSLLKALHNKDDFKLIAVTRNKKTLEDCAHYADAISDDIKSLKDCQVVFVCAPMNKTLEVLDELESILNKDTIVTDVSSLKEFVLQKERPYRFIGSHPMAGTENKGFDSSFKELFEGARWVVTPNEKAVQEDIEILKEIIEKTGAKTMIMDAKAHDSAAALISHMPMLLSQALMGAGLKEEEVLKLASSGFKDMTRLSLSNAEMANDMLKMNRENILLSLKLLNESVCSLLESDYLEKIEKIKDFRAGMYDTNGKNIL